MGKGIRVFDLWMDLDCVCWGKNIKEFIGNWWGNVNGNVEKMYGGNVWYKERNI